MKLVKISIVVLLLTPLMIRNISARPKPLYIAKVKLKSNQQQKGVFYSINDSLLTILTRDSQMISLKAQEVKAIKVWKKRRVLRSGLIGAGIGAASGAVILALSEAASNDTFFDTGQAAFLGSIGGAYSGGLGIIAFKLLFAETHYTRLDSENFSAIVEKLKPFAKTVN